jgi:hypothetical protein
LLNIDFFPDLAFPEALLQIRALLHPRFYAGGSLDVLGKLNN